MNQKKTKRSPDSFEKERKKRKKKMSSCLRGEDTTKDRSYGREDSTKDGRSDG
jgi:hypothetical protein